jgi:hypothetical protein
VGQRARQREEPDAHRDEGDELEERERDEAGGEHDHAGREQAHAEDGGPAESPAASGDREARGHRREERQAESARDDVVRHGAHRDRHEADGGEVEPRRDHRPAERARCAAADAGRQGEGQEHAVGGEEEPREDHDRVERASGQVGMGAELREVEVPPRRVAGRQDGHQHADGERQHGQLADAVRDERGLGGRARAPERGRRGRRDDRRRGARPTRGRADGGHDDVTPRRLHRRRVRRDM